MMSAHVAIEGVLVVAADAVLLAAVLDRSGDKDIASRLVGALRENSELRDVSMDDRLAIGRALEECPGEMVELRAALLSKPQPTWRQQPFNDLAARRASRLNVLEALPYE